MKSPLKPLLTQWLRNAKRLNSTLARSGRAGMASVGASPVTQLMKQAAALQAKLQAQARTQARTQARPQSSWQPQPPAQPPARSQPQSAKPARTSSTSGTRSAQPSGRSAMLSGTYKGSAGTRDYKLFLPATQPQQATPLGVPLTVPLVLMLHGCTQSPDDFAAGTRMNEAALAQGFAVLYPAQSASANPQRCWQWFKHSHQQKRRGEPAILAGMVQEVAAKHGLDGSRMFVAGLSAGGAMAAILGQTHPELFAAVGVHSGLAAGAAHDLPTALAAMRSGASPDPANTVATPVIVFHGDADATVHAQNGQWLAARGAVADSVQPVAAAAPGGRGATRSLYLKADGGVAAEHWQIHGAGHAWAGGSAQGSYTDPAGPDATAEMLRFFLQHR